jgi:CO dehydrogenase/acetyl-CoA synthase beta subunit
MDFYNLNNFEKELVYFKTRVETIISLEMGDKITMENAYKEIRRLMKKLKKSKKRFIREQKMEDVLNAAS